MTYVQYLWVVFAVACLAAALLVADFATTVYAVKRGAQEADPITKRVANAIGLLPGLVLLRLLPAAGIVYSWSVLVQWWGALLVAGVVVRTALAVINNIRVIRGIA